MPNHITTILRIEGTEAQIAEVKKAIRGEESAIDFNRIIPMPETYRKYDTTNHPNGKGLEVGKPVRPWEKDSPIVTPELLEEYEKATHDQALEYGVIGWYDWSCAHWGTKWNCYDVEDMEDGVKFDTAWSFPLPVVEALSQQFPGITFSFIYADEDVSYNTGSGKIVDGEFIDFFQPDGDTPEGWANYFATHEGEEEYFEPREDGTYKYKED